MVTNDSKSAEGYVYYVRLKTDKGVFYKIGFTTKDSVQERFSYEGSENYKLIDKVLFLKYSIYALEIEQRLHGLMFRIREYDKYHLKNIFRDLSKYPLFKDGQTEIYKEDVLGLDPDYRDKITIKNLIFSPNSDLVKKRKLDFSGYGEELRAKEEPIVYKTLDDFLSKPYFESKEDYIQRKKEWVVSFVRWSINNNFDGGAFTYGESGYFPSTYEGLLSLKEFSPNSPYVHYIPIEIKYLKNLEIVDLSRCDIIDLPKELFELGKLTVLKIWGAQITYIPSEIKKLVNLKELNLRSCHSLEDIPSSISNLDSLEEMNLSGCNNLKGIPKEINSLKNLKRIIVSNAYCLKKLIQVAPSKHQCIAFDFSQWNADDFYDIFPFMGIFINELPPKCSKTDMVIKYLGELKDFLYETKPNYLDDILEIKPIFMEEVYQFFSKNDSTKKWYEYVDIKHDNLYIEDSSDDSNHDDNFDDMQFYLLDQESVLPFDEADNYLLSDSFHSVEAILSELQRLSDFDDIKSVTFNIFFKNPPRLSTSGDFYISDANFIYADDLTFQLSNLRDDLIIMQSIFTGVPDMYVLEEHEFLLKSHHANKSNDNEFFDDDIP